MDPALKTINPHRLMLFLFPFLITIAACSTPSTPEQSVETYLNAIINGDLVRAAHSSCAAWEAQANAEASSFEAVDAELEDVVCSVSDEAGDFTLVNCTGSIVARYEGEAQDFPLNRRTFQVLFEQGQWRVCGYWKG
jgi:hypothetical protein